jgi:hypothetical protein
MVAAGDEAVMNVFAMPFERSIFPRDAIDRTLPWNSPEITCRAERTIANGIGGQISSIKARADR